MKTLLFVSLISLSSIAQSEWAWVCSDKDVKCKGQELTAIKFTKGKDKMYESPLTCAEVRLTEETTTATYVKSVYIDCWVDDETRIRIKAPDEKKVKFAKSIKVD